MQIYQKNNSLGRKGVVSFCVILPCTLGKHNAGTTIFLPKVSLKYACPHIPPTP